MEYRVDEIAMMSGLVLWSPVLGQMVTATRLLKQVLEKLRPMFFQVFECISNKLMSATCPLFVLKSLPVPPELLLKLPQYENCVLLCHHNQSPGARVLAGDEPEAWA